jgi:TRAP-type C4-dicarboxylate transport system substrate-binding protein
MKPLAYAVALTAAQCGSALAQTKWDLPAACPATNFHSVNLQQFADDVDKASGGKLKITVHPNASPLKAPEIERAAQGGQAQIGQILLVNFQHEWQVVGADGIAVLATSCDDAVARATSQPGRR